MTNLMFHVSVRSVASSIHNEGFCLVPSRYKCLLQECMNRNTVPEAAPGGQPGSELIMQAPVTVTRYVL